ncbi:MAG: hypothetical protein R3B13_16705 [Polyangiaceae bacterium]
MFGPLKKRNDAPSDLDAAVKLFQQRKFGDALRCADAIIAADPSLALSHRFRGEVLFEMARWSDCQQAFEQAEVIGGPGTEECFFWRALAASNAGDSARAMFIIGEYRAKPDAAPDMVARCHALLERLGPGLAAQVAAAMGGRVDG